MRILMGAAAATAVLTMAGCGPANSGSLGSAPQGSPAASHSPSQSPSSGPAASAAATARKLTVQVWLVRGNRLFAATRARPAEITTGRLALAALAEGVTPAERAAGVRTGIAPGADFGLSLAGGVATVDPPEDFYAGGQDAVRMRQAQVVYTLTQYPTIKSVAFAAGRVKAAPVTRAAYAGLLPPIVVVSPSVGTRVGSPALISGSADVFEATVSVRILDADGAEIATRFTSATSGSGTRGTYSVAVPYTVASQQAGTIEVFEVSAKDGTRLNAVKIPVTLTP
jgi:hypothetical protein